MMGEHGATMGTARDLRARVILALISTSMAKPNAGRAAALVEEARTIMGFINGDAEAATSGATSADAASPDDAAAAADRSAET